MEKEEPSLPLTQSIQLPKNQHVFNKCNVDHFIWPSVHKIILLYVWKQHTSNKIMKTFTIHKYTDLMQDVYSSLEIKFFFLSVLFFWQHFFFYICYEKVAPKGIFGKQIAFFECCWILTPNVPVANVHWLLLALQRESSREGQWKGSRFFELNISNFFGAHRTFWGGGCSSIHI